MNPEQWRRYKFGSIFAFVIFVIYRLLFGATATHRSELPAPTLDTDRGSPALS